jgi:hypothetical protein
LPAFDDEVAIRHTGHRADGAWLQR